MASFFIGENVNDHIAEVEKDPVPFAVALFSGRFHAECCHLFFHFIRRGLRLLLISGRAEDEIICDRSEITDIQYFNEYAFLIR